MRGAERERGAPSLLPVASRPDAVDPQDSDIGHRPREPPHVHMRITILLLTSAFSFSAAYPFFFSRTRVETRDDKIARHPRRALIGPRSVLMAAVLANASKWWLALISTFLLGGLPSHALSEPPQQPVAPPARPLLPPPVCPTNSAIA